MNMSKSFNIISFPLCSKVFLLKMLFVFVVAALLVYKPFLVFCTYCMQRFLTVSFVLKFSEISKNYVYVCAVV